MTPLSFAHDEAAERLELQVGDFVAAAATFDDLELLDPSDCRGWSRLDVVVHVRMGLQEMAAAAVGSGGGDDDGHPDHDAASYWTSHPDGRDDDPVPHILWLRRVAAAHARPSGAVAHLRDAAQVAVTAARAMRPGVLPFQGKRLRSGDFLATWVVELAVHGLDLRVDEEPAGLDWARATLEALAGAPLPRRLSDRDAVRAGLGRGPTPAGVLLDPAYPVSL